MPVIVVDPGHQRRHQHARRDPVAGQLGDRFEAQARVRRVRLGCAPRLLVERRDREVGRELGALDQLAEQLQVA
jgi:hypothetical protein